MKKIAIVVQRFGEEIMGGAERHALYLAKKLSEFYDITVLTTKAKDYYTWKNEYSNFEDNVSGIKTLRFETDFQRDKKSFDELSNELFYNPSNLDLNFEWMKAQGPFSTSLFNFLGENDGKFDLFIFVTYLYASTVFGYSKINKSKKILIPTAHDEKPIYLEIFKKLFTSMDGIIYNTESEKRFVEGLFGNESVLNVVAGISVEFPENYKILNRNIQKSDRFSYLGRIDENKGLKELFEFYKKGNIKKKLVLAGKKYLKIPSSIEYLGVISENEKFDLIFDSDFIIIPSKYESLSLLLLEAFMCGKAVLVNANSEVLKEHVIKSNGGLCYNDFESFCESVLWLEENQNKVRLMGENGRRYFEENYSEKIVISKIRNFLKNFL